MWLRRRGGSPGQRGPGAFSLSQLWDTPRLNEASGLCARRPWRASYKGSEDSGARREISVNFPPAPASSSCTLFLWRPECW